MWNELWTQFHIEIFVSGMHVWDNNVNIVQNSYFCGFFLLIKMIKQEIHWNRWVLNFFVAKKLPHFTKLFLEVLLSIKLLKTWFKWDIFRGGKLQNIALIFCFRCSLNKYQFLPRTKTNFLLQIQYSTFQVRQLSLSLLVTSKAPCVVVPCEVCQVCRCSTGHLTTCQWSSERSARHSSCCGNVTHTVTAGNRHTWWVVCLQLLTLEKKVAKEVPARRTIPATCFLLASFHENF